MFMSRFLKAVYIPTGNLGVSVNQGTNARNVISEVHALFVLQLVYCLWEEK